MKKSLIYTLCSLFLLTLFSCGEKTPEGITPDVFTISKDKVEFSIFGGTSTVTIKGKENSIIEITTKATGDWFTFSEENGELTISTGLNEVAEAKEGKITISAKGYQDAEIEVLQAAAATILWDNPSAYYMNLKGGVKTVDFHDYLMRESSINTLQFNEGGWLTSFALESRTATLSYDDQNRLSEIISSDKGSMKLTYGTHGQYISTEDLFFKELAYSAVVLDYPAWMPLFIKNLEKIEVVKNEIIESTYEIIIVDDAGKCILNSGEDDPVFTFTVADNFMASAIYGGGFYGAESKYNVDTATGKLSKIEITDPWGALVYTFNPDRINSFAKVEGDTIIEATYNENLDLKTLGDNTYGYTYDAQKNWISRTKNEVEDKVRSIEYWK